MGNILQHSSSIISEVLAEDESKGCCYLQDGGVHRVVVQRSCKCGLMPGNHQDPGGADPRARESWVARGHRCHVSGSAQPALRADLGANLLKMSSRSAAQDSRCWGSFPLTQWKSACSWFSGGSCCNVASMAKISSFTLWTPAGGGGLRACNSASLSRKVQRYV